ncbi:MAG: right-handed parallel beta-helix repeat-containing protein [Bacteroidetes bacterium]|nr:right-handed parallel beta-helix repeat-containing protein [Bacteroidota bacterium]
MMGFRFLLICLTALSLSWPARLQAESIEVSGTVSGVWAVDTVKVTGNIELRGVDSLRISPGVCVSFQGAYYFKVLGSLRAIGSSSRPVVFTIDDTTGFGNPVVPDGGWKQIRIENQGKTIDSVIFDYCHFKYGKAVDADSIHGYGGALCIRNSDNIDVRQCTFSNNYAYFSGGAIYLEHASIKVSNNRFENNSCGQAAIYYGYGGALCSDWGSSLISQNYFAENSSTGIGGGLCVRFHDNKVLHNTFDNNFSALGGGMGMLHIDSCEFVISNNLVINNRARFFGAGISNGDCSPLYVNNTIFSNHCEGGGGGFYCKDSVSPVMYNNILYGNTQYSGQSNQVYLWDRLSQPDFYFNDIEGGTEGFDGTGAAEFTGQFQNNIDLEPEFVGQSYIPAIHSPCVNAGNPDTTGCMIPPTDLAGNYRLIDNRIDLGAYEQQQLLSIDGSHKPGIPLDQLMVWPNPAVHEINIEFNLATATSIRVFLTNHQGVVLQEIKNGYFGSGYNHMRSVLNIGHRVSGAFLLFFQMGEVMVAYPLVLAKQ